MDGNGFFRRLVALCRKEFVQLWRDNSSLLIGTVLPILLIIIIGSGINLDVKNAPIAVVLASLAADAASSAMPRNVSTLYASCFVLNRERWSRSISFS